MPQIIQVIESNSTRGLGNELSPVRVITQYHTLNGELLATFDPCEPQYESGYDGGIQFAKWVVKTAERIERGGEMNYYALSPGNMMRSFGSKKDRDDWIRRGTKRRMLTKNELHNFWKKNRYKSPKETSR